MAAVVSPGADGAEDQLVAGLEIRFRLDQGQRNACAGGVAHLFDVEEEAIEGHAAAFGRRFQDPAVGLMRNDPARFFGGPAGLGKCVANDGRKTLGGKAEQGLAVDADPRIEFTFAIADQHSPAVRGGPCGCPPYRRREAPGECDALDRWPK